MVKRMVIDTKNEDGGGRIIFSDDSLCDGCGLKLPLDKPVYFLDVDKKVMCRDCVFKGHGSDRNTFHSGHLKLKEKRGA